MMSLAGIRDIRYCLKELREPKALETISVISLIFGAQVEEVPNITA